MGIKLVVFDFDGTLADSKSTWKKDIEKVLKHHDVEKAENIAHIALVVGRRLDEAMRPLKLKRNKEDAYRLEIYKEFIDGVGKMKFCPGFNTLTKIKQPMIIVSNAQEFLIREFMSKKRKLKMFKAIYGAGDFDKKYKKLRQIRKEYKLKKEENVYHCSCIKFFWIFLYSRFCNLLLKKMPKFPWIHL